MNYENFNPRAFLLAQARELLTQAANAAMADGSLPQAELPAFITEIPADRKNGDVASNMAMAGARAWHKAPKMIADAILAHLPSLQGTCWDRAEVAGPGFINLYTGADWLSTVVLAAATNPEYGRTNYGNGQKYNVEFVSANPTGPMHMGNARGGALGDCLAAVLDWAGYQVTREFYLNDAGNQIQKFGKSLAVRYLQKCLGEQGYPLPEECYQGADIMERAVAFGEAHEAETAPLVEACRALSGDALYESEAFAQLKEALVNFALPINIANMEKDLGKYRISYDTWFKESTLHASGAVQAVVDKLLASGACYKAEDGAVMYRSAQYAAKYGTVNKKKTDDGSEEEAKDEVLVRGNGIPTYFAADIAYHYNKLAVRGFDKAIDIWGADHHGHVARMKGAMDAIGLNGEQLDVVPIDSARFLFNEQQAGSAMDFDLDLAIKQDNDNPVYYVQYAHARICSILKKLESEGVVYGGEESWHGQYTFAEPAELELIRMLEAFPAEIVLSAQKYDPARINHYVTALAAAFHKFYNTCRLLGEQPATLQARLALCLGVKAVIYNVLTMFKITVPEKM